MTDPELITAAVEASGMSARRFAARILSREERTIRRWQAGEIAIPSTARAWLERWLSLSVFVVAAAACRRKTTALSLMRRGVIWTVEFAGRTSGVAHRVLLREGTRAEYDQLESLPAQQRAGVEIRAYSTRL